MSASTPPPPTSGNGKYVIVAVLLLVGIVGLVIWKNSQKPDQPVTTTPPPTAAPPVSTNPLVVDVPPPPPEEPDAGPTRRIVSSTASGCDNKACNGTTTNDLESALAFRAKQAHRCYDQALAADSTLKGKVAITVRVAANGNVCSANVVSNDMGTNSVAQCVAGYFRATGHFPQPKGGCVEAQVPISFVPGGK